VVNVPKINDTLIIPKLIDMKTLYDEIGAERLSQMIDRFYDVLFTTSSIKDLFDETQHESIRDKQKKFLSQFLGGPALYSQEFGHPKMKLRHMPHKITVEARDEWLRCMKSAIDSMEFENNLGDALYNCFPQVANHMVNS